MNAISIILYTAVLVVMIFWIWVIWDFSKKL